MTTIYLVRHCEAEGNTKRYFQGHSDGTVSPNGELQCRQLAERFRTIHLDAVYSSPLKRAYFTAQAVDHYHGLPIQTDPGLMEINGGHWEGHLWAELPDLFPEEADAWAHRPWEFAPKGGESMREVYDRIWNTVVAIAEKNDGKQIAIVSHGCAIRNLLTRIKFGEIEKLGEMGWCDNTAVSLLRWEKGRMQLVMENDAAHLDETTSTLHRQTWWREGRKSPFE